ncbi:MAG: ABC transporter ATP-binding protein [Chitinophagaceae bacterium]
MQTVLRVQGLSKNFGEIRAVENLSFSMEEGKVYGFLGQNGAGKSTTIRMLLTLIEPSAGSIEIFGMDLRKHRNEILRQTGAIIEKPDLYKYLTATENLSLFARLSRYRATSRQIMEQLEMVGLADRAYSKVRTYSQGMKQRLGLACALIHQPRLIILDEPTNGLDPQGIADMRRMIVRLSREQGKSILVSSHLLSEMEVVADAMLIIHKGKKIVEGNVRDLLDPGEVNVELVADDTLAAMQMIRGSEWNECLLDGPPGPIRLHMKKEDIPLLNKRLVENGIGVSGGRAINTLEAYFLSQTRET